MRKRKAPGRHRRLTSEQEARFVWRVKAGVLPGDVASSPRGPQMRTILDREFGKTFSVNGIDELLNRHGRVCLKPCPRHPRQDPVAAKVLKRRPFFCEQSSGFPAAPERSRRSQESRPPRARGDGAGPSRLAHREAAQVAKTNDAAFFRRTPQRSILPNACGFWFREHDWSNRVYPDEAALVQEAKRSGRKLSREQVRSNRATRWVTREN
mgnify:CR=1 FL=1